MVENLDWTIAYDDRIMELTPSGAEDRMSHFCAVYQKSWLASKIEVCLLIV